MRATSQTRCAKLRINDWTGSRGQELKEGAREATQSLQEGLQILADLIVADEDAKYPGCRNAEGELILGGLTK